MAKKKADKATKDLTNKKVMQVGGKKMTMGWEPTAAPIILPPEVMQKMCEEFAEQVRDKVNSAVGTARLAISMFHPYSDQSVSILFKDTTAPTGMDRLCLGWSEGCDVDATVALILNGQLEHDLEDDNG